MKESVFNKRNTRVQKGVASCDDILLETLLAAVPTAEDRLRAESSWRVFRDRCLKESDDVTNTKTNT